MKNSTNRVGHHAVLILALIGLITSFVLELGAARLASAHAAVLPDSGVLVADGPIGFNSPVATRLVPLSLAAILQERGSQQENPDLQAIRFTWTRGQNSLIRGAQNPGGPITAPTTNGQDLASRRAEMRNTERNAAISTDGRGNFYLLHLEVKNTGTRVIKSFAWEYKPTATPDDYEPTQYICLARTKPNQSKTVNLVSPFAPIKVINVGVRADGLKEGEVIVNRIEYEDGSVWRRAGWLIELPPDTTKKMTSGQCAFF